MQSVLYYNCQGDRDADRPSYGLSAVCAKATKKNKKIIENPLTKSLKYDTIRVQKEADRSEQPLPNAQLGEVKQNLPTEQIKFKKPLDKPLKV